MDAYTAGFLAGLIMGVIIGAVAVAFLGAVKDERE